jgi:hypothetical protein
VTSPSSGTDNGYFYEFWYQGSTEEDVAFVLGSDEETEGYGGSADVGWGIHLRDMLTLGFW